MVKLVGPAALAMLGLSAISCGSPPATTQSPTPSNQVAGAASCRAAESQDLVISGQLSGHVTCSKTSPTCSRAWTTPRPPGGLIAPIEAAAGGTPIHLTVVFSGSFKVGTYPAGDPGEGAAATSNYGVTLDGAGSWVSAVGGSVVMSAVDSSSASGTVDVKLHPRLGGTGMISLVGSWRCLIPAGF
ncbi:MAG: hypothetical protein ACYDAL_00170 [Candidatus Dormibacteraceae bacterium]